MISASIKFLLTSKLTEVPLSYNPLDSLLSTHLVFFDLFHGDQPAGHVS